MTDDLRNLEMAKDEASRSDVDLMVRRHNGLNEVGLMHAVRVTAVTVLLAEMKDTANARTAMSALMLEAVDGKQTKANRIVNHVIEAETRDRATEIRQDHQEAIQVPKRSSRVSIQITTA